MRAWAVREDGTGPATRFERKGSAYNSKLWNSGLESDKEIARKQKRRLHYITNILVVKDAAHPENEGKVFLYRHGPKIYTKVKDAMSPPEGFEDETPIVAWDPYNGANFKLKIRRVEGYPNYDASTFDSPAPIYDDDDRVEALSEKLYSLKEFTDPNAKDVNGFPLFKPYDELEEKLYKVLEIDRDVRTPTERITERTESTRATNESRSNLTSKDEDDSPWGDDPKSVGGGDSTAASDDDDDTLEYFKRLAAES